jgi:hypothetical protein
MVHSGCRDSLSRSHTVRALALLLLLSLLQASSLAPAQSEARKVSEPSVPFTPDAFIDSVIAGDKNTVELFLKAGMSPNVAFKRERFLEVGNRIIENGDPALIIAMRFGRDDIVALLLSHGVDVNKPSDNGCSPLMIAKGDLVKALLDRGADTNSRGPTGYTALMIAVSDGDLDKLKLLLDRGAEINTTNDRGYAAIQMAAIARRREIFILLRERGADVSVFSQRSLNALLNDPDPGDEVVQLIQRLHPITVGNSSSGPSPEDQSQVPEELLKIAARSAESRARVIDSLMDVVEDLSARDESPIAIQWMKAVNVLGQLRAVEAVDSLINSLGHSGQNGIIMSLSIDPPHRALLEIGEPAVPKLVGALTHPDHYIRTRAAWLLVEIEEERARDAIQAALEKETDEKVSCEFQRTLDWMKGMH